MKSADVSQTKHSIESSAVKAKQDLESRPYIGWIPTANGRLSFRHIGDARHPTESICANLDLEVGRVIVAYQRRPLSDILFPRLIHQLLNISGDFWFVITAQTNESSFAADTISGKISIYKAKEDWRTKADKPVRANIRELNKLRFSHSPDKAALADLNYARASELVASTSDIQIEFDLERDGEVRFGRPEYREKALEKASVSFAAAGGHDLQKWIADQSYFFLRDIAHAHQHHEPYSDTILILQERDVEDIKWRKKIIYSLQYAIIRFKRDADVTSTLRAMGILAYCNSFEATCRQQLGERFSQFDEFNTASLMQSLQAKASEISIREQEFANMQSVKFARAGTLRTIAVGAVAIVIAILAILIQPRISRGHDEKLFPKLFDASTFAADNFFSFLGLGFVIIVVTWVATRSDWTIKTKPGRSILEATYVNRWVSATLIILAGAVVAAVTAKTNLPASRDIYETIRDLISLFIS